jgi:hypothetical protein
MITKIKKLFTNVDFKFEARELENLMCAVSLLVLVLLCIVLTLTFALLGDIIYFIPVPFIAYASHKLINQNQF